jgi:aminopeptidase
MNQSQQQMLEKFAQVTLEIGLGFKPGKRLLIQAQVKEAAFVRAVVRAAYERGASFVEVLWYDEDTDLIRHQLAPRDSFETFSAWQASALNDLATRGDCRLYIAAQNPRALEGQDSELVQVYQRAFHKAVLPFYKAMDSGQIAWSLVAPATEDWAQHVFPNLAPGVALQKLSDAVLHATGIDQADPIAFWQKQVRLLDQRCEHLNAKQYSALRFTGKGTKLEIGLVQNHVWVGGQGVTQDGLRYTPNLPTYEVFTMPHRERTNGTVRGARPAVINGTIVEGWSLEFKDGVIVNAKAERGEAALHQLISSDEGSKRLGEVALVPKDSPVGETGVVFQHILFDENAASHIALGNAYRMTMQGGEELKLEAFLAAGGNESMEHYDLMIGADDTDVDGVQPDGSSEAIMRNGLFVFGDEA